MASGREEGSGGGFGFVICWPGMVCGVVAAHVGELVGISMKERVFEVINAVTAMTSLCLEERQSQD